MDSRAARGADGVAAPAPGEGWRLEGDLGLDGAWTLDPYLDREAGVTATGELLERSWVRPMSRPSASLGVRMASLLSSRTWPADLVVVPVPSSNDATDVLARVVALVLEREPQRLIVARRGMRHSAPAQRYRVGGRRVPDHVLLVDDVVRTGATLRVCADLLRARGAVGVWAVTATAELSEAGRRVGVQRGIARDLDLPETMLARVDALRPGAAARAVDPESHAPLEVAERVPLFDQGSPEFDTADDDPMPAVDSQPVDDAPIDVLDDEELMAAVGRAFEAIAGLEALQKIVEQVSPEESLSIEGLLSELLAAGTDADDGADGGGAAIEADRIDGPKADDATAEDHVAADHDAGDRTDLEVDEVEVEVDVAIDVVEPVDAPETTDESVATDAGDAPTEAEAPQDDVDEPAAAEAPATPVAQWRGRRRRQKPRPSTMR